MNEAIARRLPATITTVRRGGSPREKDFDLVRSHPTRPLTAILVHEGGNRWDSIDVNDITIVEIA